MISKINSVIKRWRSLGGFNTLRFFVNYVQNNGLVSALVQVYKRLFWEAGRQYFIVYNRWYQRKNIHETVSSAIDVFPKSHILIAGDMALPQCKKYRILQKVEFFSKIGINCSISSYQDIHRVMNNMQLATQLLLYRVPDGDLAQGIISEAKRLGIAVGYDIDDPIFDLDVYRMNPNLEFIDAAEKSALLNSTILYLNAIKQTDFVIASTLGMATIVKKHFQNEVIHWPNVIDGETQSILGILDEKSIETKKNISETKQLLTIGYMSGSRAHEQDFRIIAQSLHDIMVKYPEVRLLVGGYCKLPQKFLAFQKRIVQFPFVGYHGYFSQLQNIDINIVPLVANDFNECKSGIRFLEASMLSVPTIASEVGDFKHLIRNGETGFLASTPQEWTQAIELLITQSQLRQKIGIAARQFVMDTNTIETLIPFVKPQLNKILRRRSKDNGDF